MNPLWPALFIMAPLPVLIIMGRIRIRRWRRLAAEEPTPSRPFEPQAEVATSALLQSFSPIERVYLRQQFPTARIGFYIVTWLVFSIMAASLVPDNVHRYRVAQSTSMAVWYSFLHASILLAPLSTVIGIFTALVAITGMTGNAAQTGFYRTRPITYQLLFWGRVLPAVSVMLLGYVAGIATALAALVALYGPVWRHLDVSGLAMLLKLWQVHELVWMLRSPFPMFVSIAASMLLVFSIAMAVILQPFQHRSLPKPIVLSLGIIAFEAYSIAGEHYLFSNLSRLGLTASGSGAPAPLPMYLLPLALSGLLLWIAQIAASRKEN